MGSKSRIAKHIIPIIQRYIDENNIETYIEPFCLSGKTILFTEKGIKNLEDIVVGDNILDDTGHYTKVVKKVRSPKKNGKYIKIKGNADIIATDNHLFYVNGVETNVDKLIVGDSLDIGISTNSVNEKIDLSKYITISKSPRKGRSGKVVDGDKIKLYHNAPITNRFIPITKELMRCYGLIVAEGDKSNITMNKNEIKFLHEFVCNYEKILGISARNNKKYYFRNNACQLAVPYKKIYEKLFFEAMNIGYGARNKNISFLFSLTTDMVREALKYMYIGDGCCIQKGEKVYRSLNYKTSSKTLAYQLQMLLSINFGIKSTISHGINNKRYIEQRKLTPSDYYNVSITRDQDIETLTGNKNNDIYIKEKTRKYVITNIYDVQDTFFDITVDNSSHKFLLNGGIVTHNCGGANIIDKIQCKEKYGFDKNKYLIALLKRVQCGESLYEEVSKELYDKARVAFNSGDTSKFEDWEIGNIGFLASFNGRWFDGGYAKTGYEKTKNGLRLRNYYQESKNNILIQAPNLAGIRFGCCDYKEISLFSNDVNMVIYCDPPYQGTKQYANATKFDYETFWQWCREMSKMNTVLISEQNAPEDFKNIWEQEVSRSIKAVDKSKSVEKLFIYNP